MGEETKTWRVLVATDGSAGADRAVAAAVEMPWPDGSEVRVVSAVEATGWMPETSATLRARAEAAVATARAKLEKIGRRASSGVLLGSPSRVILDTASDWHADVVVVGSRGLGAVRGLLIGSVSSAVARAATCSVLVVKGNLGKPLNAVMAVDGSGDARRAAERLASLRAPGNAVTVVRVIEPMRVATLGVLPKGIAGAIRAEVGRATAEMKAGAQRDTRAVAAIFRQAGWKTREAVRAGAPSVEIIALARRSGAQLAGVGPRGVTRIEQILLGSVTDRLLFASGISVFIGR